MHLEALTEKSKELFPLLKSFSGFYLAGGTALALQIGHRISVDFDFFSDSPIKASLSNEVKRIFPSRQITISVNNQDELTVFTNDTKLTFLHYPFSVQEALVEYDGLKLLGVKEIGATKAYTLGRRGSFKDYVDLFFIISEQNISLNEIIVLSQQKYGHEFNGRLFLEQLVYTKDIEDTEILFLKKPITKDDIQTFFEKEVAALHF